MWEFNFKEIALTTFDKICSFPKVTAKLLFKKDELMSLNISTLEMIGQGNTAEVYAYESDKILKLFREGLSGEIISREYENAVVVQSCIKNTPKVYDLITEGNRQGIVYERISGQDMIATMVKAVFRVNYYAKLLASTHQEVHHITIKTSEMPSVKEKLFEDIHAVEAMSDKQKEQLSNYLNKLPDGTSLCHFDYHPGNILMSEEEPIIIDWMTACVGDRCADVARTSIMLTFGELPNANRLTRKLIALFQGYVYQIYYREYLKLSGLSEKAIEKWLLPVAAARLREWIPGSEKEALRAFVAKELEEMQ